MWLVLSLISSLCAVGVLGAGLLWPWVGASTANRATRSWLSPWWQAWMQICLPLLSWRYRWYLQGLLQSSSEPMETEVFFARQCFLFMWVLVFGAVSVFFLNQAWSYGLLVLVGASLAFYLPIITIKQKRQQHKRQMQRDFPFMLDLLCLSIESGHGLQQALLLCSAELPVGPLRNHLIKVQEAMRAGLTREDAFQQFATQVDLDEAQAFVAALQQSIELGGRLAPMLKQQSQQRRQERFLRAEKKALEAPVKMLMPLVLCIFPCTFLVIAYPLFFQLWQQLQ